MAKFLDYTGLGTLWGKIKLLFLAKPAASGSAGSQVANIVEDASGNVTIAASGYTIAKSVPSDAKFTDTDTKVTSVSNHYTTSGAQTGTLGSSTARYYIKTITTDAAGHITAVTTGNETVTNSNTAQLQVGSTSDRKINTSESTGKFIQFTGGTNKITVTDAAGSSFDVNITPSISNNTTGSGLTENTIILGTGGSGIKTSGKTIVTTLGNDDATIPTSKAVQTAITTATSGLSGAMHFIGTSTTAITDGGTEAPTISGYSGTAKTAGNVVLYGSQEFVWTGSAWELLGDEGSYALKTIKVEGTGALGGGGNLTANRTITHNALGPHANDTAQSYGPGADVTGTEGQTIKVPQISVDKYGHVTAVTERTYTSKNTTYTVNNATLSLQGSASNASATSTGFSANGSTNTTLKFAVGTGNTISSVTTAAASSGVATVTINGATMPTQLKNPNAIKFGTKPSSSGTATDVITYDGSEAKALYFSTAAATNTNVKFAVDSNGFITGTVTESVNTDTKVTSVDNHYAPEADNGAELTASLSGTAGSFSTNTEYTVLTGVKAQRDAKGHVVGLTYTAQKVKDTTIANTDRYVNSASFASAGTNGASGVTMTLTRAGSDTQTVTGTIPVATTSAAGVMTGAMVTKLNGIATGATANTGTVTSVGVGSGLLNGSGTTAITTSGTLKVNLADYTVAENASLASGDSSTRMYAVRLDSAGHLAVTVPWTNTTYDSITETEINTICVL